MADLICERCGNSDPRLFAYRKGKPYCRACLSFSGRQADKTYRVKEGIRLSLSYPLSPRQEACAQKALSLLESGKDVLIHAVTGAGKTELVYPAMARYLEMGLHVGFATPRRDVVIDLLPRIQEAFPMAEVIAVYGGHTQKLEGDIIVLTAHQLYRYEAYFDLLVFDEIDAFPYRGDKMLNRFYLKSIRGKSILLSATPSMSDIHDIESKGGVVLDLFEIGARLVVEGTVLFRFLVETHVQRVERAQASLFDILFFAPALVRGNEFSELRAVVAEVVDADGRIAQKLMQFIERAAEHGRGEMPDMEGFCDVDGRIVYADGFALSLVGSAVTFALFQNFAQRFPCPEGAVDLEIQIAVDRGHL